jgi:lysophospholipase L1-like esterase
LLFELDPSRADLLTVSGGLITAARDAGGGSVVLDQARNAHLTAGAINGRAALSFVLSETPYLYSTTGGLIGQTPHSTWMLVRFSVAPPAGFHSIMEFGSNGGNNSVLGTAAANQLWGGGAGFGSPTSTSLGTETLNDGTAGTTLPTLALLLATYGLDSFGAGPASTPNTTNNQWCKRIFVDDLQVAITAPEALNINSAQFGFNAWSAGGNPVSCDVLEAGFAAVDLGAYTASAQDLRTKLVAYAKRLAGSSYAATKPAVICDGDSLTEVGYPSQLATLFGAAAQVINLGKSGTATSEMIARAQFRTYPRLGARRQSNWLVQGGATNDILAGASAASIIANLITLYANARAAGYRVCAWTIPPGATTLSGHYTAPQETVRQAVNAWIRTTGATLVDAVVDLASIESTLSQDAYHIDGIHFTSAGYLLIAQAIYAVLVSRL